MEIGLHTFGDVGGEVTPAIRLRRLVEEIELADQIGLDVFGVGEHHRPDYAVSAPPVVLAAARTERIRLTSAVTVLSSDDPIRVFQQFSTLDNLTGGRAEIMAGRGSFIESFPLFGLSLDDYDALFSEKLGMLLELNRGGRLTWPGGRFTPKVEGQGVFPRPVQDPLPIWIAVGGTPQSVVRAGMLGLPLALAIIGGEVLRFAPLLDLFREAARRGGKAAPKTSINVHGFVADTTQAAIDAFYGPQAAVMDRIGRERGWPPQTRAQFDAAVSPRGNLFLGSPQQVIDKVLAAHEVMRFDRILIQMAVGLVEHRALLRAIELMGTVVAPALRSALARPGSS